VIIPLPGSPDFNFMVDHTHPESGRITVRGMIPFIFDPPALSRGTISTRCRGVLAHYRGDAWRNATGPGSRAA
jgi:hypothetical protein